MLYLIWDFGTVIVYAIILIYCKNLIFIIRDIINYRK